MRFFPRCATVLAFLVAGCMAAPTPAQALLTNGENAIDILGEFSSVDDTAPDYVKACANDSESQIGFGFNGTQGGVAIDATNHYLYVADGGNNRVLVFALNSNNTLNSKTPTYVLGQPDLVSCNKGVTQSTMNFPNDVKVDPANNRLFVADNNNARVLVFNTASLSNGMNASNVLGQANFTSKAVATTQAGMNQPNSLAYDSANTRLFVADWGNNRVLVFSTSTITNGMNAANELGQPSGTAFTSSTAALTQAGLSGPSGLALDSTNNRLFVAETGNNRVTVFSIASITNGENASNELGQPSGTAFTSSTANTTQSGLDTPWAVAFDAANNRLFVVDQNNDRVMVFSTSSITNGENASNVIGNTVYTTDAFGVSQSLMQNPRNVFLDSTNNYLYVVDSGNNRVLLFSTASISNGENASDLLGQYTSPTSTATVTYTQSIINNGIIHLGLSNPGGIALDAVNHHLFVTDTGNNRVLVYNLNTDNSLSTSSGGHTPSNVLGHADFISSGTGHTQSTMNRPLGLAFDSANNRLFVADSNNNRVLVFNTSAITDGMNASNVLGQTNFTNHAVGLTQLGLNDPESVAYDAVNGRLFVADNDASRVMVFNVAPGTIANGENAANELGQPSGTAFTSSTAALTQAGMSCDDGVAYDAANSRLFVGDFCYFRVTVYNVAPGSIANGMNAAYVLGQPNFTTGTSNTTAAGMAGIDGMTYDANSSRLFVGDQANNRVLVYNVGPGSIANGMNAAYVLGQANFTSGGAATTQSGMSNAVTNLHMYYDPGSGRLFTSDGTNNRVLIFEGSTNSTPAQWGFTTGYE